LRRLRRLAAGRVVEDAGAPEGDAPFDGLAGAVEGVAGWVCCRGVCDAPAELL
jgi:hypothetical protein